MENIDDLMHELDLAGPLAPVLILKDIADAFPLGDTNRRYLEGYIAGRSGEHDPDRMNDPEFSAGWLAGNRPWGRA